MYKHKSEANSTNIMLMIDLLGVKNLIERYSKVFEGDMSIPYPHLYVEDYFRRGIEILYKHFRSGSGHIFAYGDTICIYDDASGIDELPADRDIDDDEYDRIFCGKPPWYSKRLVSIFAKRACRTVADLIESHYPIRAYLSSGDMYEMDFSQGIRELFSKTKLKATTATSIGAALVSAVALERCGIKSVGLFVSKQYAKDFDIQVVNAKFQISDNSDVSLVDFKHYLGKARFGHLIKEIRLFSHNEQVEHNILSDWLKGVKKEYALSEKDGFNRFTENYRDQSRAYYSRFIDAFYAGLTLANI